MVKKQDKIKPVEHEVTEYEGHHIGDVVYCLLKGKPHRGSISHMHIREGQEPHFSFLDEAGMKNLVSRFSDIINEPTRKQVQAIEREIKKNKV